MQRQAALDRLSHLTFALTMACGVGAQAVEAATAETVWRCRTPSGATVAYQSTPCQDGGKAMPASKPPAPADREASARVAKREARLARSLGKQRIQREKNLPPAHASLSGPVRQVSVGQREDAQLKARGDTRRRSADKTAESARQRRRDVFRAEVPGTARTRSRATQAADAAAASLP